MTETSSSLDRATTNTSREWTRREVLATGGVLAGGIAAKKLIDQSPLLKASLGAYRSRADVITPNITLLDQEIPKSNKLQETYNHLFGEKERESFTYGDFEGYYSYFSETAMIYYDKEKKPGEGFADYLDRYTDQAADIAKGLDLDFALYLIFAKRANSVAGPEATTKDIDISRKQLLITAAERLLGAEGHLVAALSAPQEGRNVADRVRFKIDTKIDGDLPIPIRQAPRLDGPLTLGAYDLETINYALAVVDNPAAEALLKKKYHDVLGRFKKLKDAHNNVQKSKSAAVTLIDTIYPQLEPLIDDFLQDGNESHLSAIGIEEDTIDDWHRTHSNIPHAHFLFGTDLKTAAENTRAFYQGTFQRDKPDKVTRGKTLLRDELLNPKFLPYLRQSALLKGGDYSDLLAQLDTTASAIDGAVQDGLVAEREADATIGPLETDSQYQLLTTAAHLKRLQTIVENHQGHSTDLANRNEIAYLLYRMETMNDWPAFFVQTGRFGSLPTTKAESWDTTSPQILDGIDMVLEKASQLGYPLTPNQDMANFLLQMSAFAYPQPNPFVIPVDIRDRLADDVWLYMFPPPGPVYLLEPYVKGDDMPVLTLEQRKQVWVPRRGFVANEITDSAQYKSDLKETIRYIEQNTSLGDTIEIMLQMEHAHFDRPIILPKDRNVVLMGMSPNGGRPKITLGAGVDRVFVTDRNSGPCNVWIDNIDFQVDQHNFHTPLTLVDFDGKGSGNLFARHLRVEDKKGKRATNASIKVSNATAFYAEDCSFSGDAPIVVNGAEYVSINNSQFKAIGRSGSAVKFTGTNINGHGNIDGFAPLYINNADLDGYMIAISTDSPKVMVQNGKWKVENFANFSSNSGRLQITVGGTNLLSVPTYQGGFDLHLNGTTIHADDPQKTHDRLSNILKYDQRTVFTSSGNDVWLPWGLSREQQAALEQLDGPLFSMKRRPAKSIFIPMASR